MRRVSILSPHRDDAAFSLFICLAKWSASPSVKLKVLNFFTESAYAPNASASDASSVSGIRKREDLRALAFINRSIQVTDRKLLDAPLRLGIAPSVVCNAETQGLIGELLIAQLTKDLRQRRADLAISPLGLGGHVDHIAVRRAAVRAIAPASLAFYEDLPYATWTPENVLHEHVSQVEEAIGTELKPVIIRDRKLAKLKHRAVAQYRSQIDWQDASAIASWSKHYGGGERIWRPRGSAPWAALN